MAHKHFRILLAHSNMLKNDSKQAKKMKPYPPLATIQAASILRDNGFEVALFDPTFDQDLDELDKLLGSFCPDLVVVYEDFFNFITKMCLLHMRETALEIGRLARENGAVTIAASPDTSDHPEYYLDQVFDYALIGEADLALLETCLALSEQRDPLASGVKGVAGLDSGGNLKKNPYRPLIKDLSELPMPAWDLVTIEPYRQAWLEKHNYFSLNMVSSRGCSYSCNWCAKPIWGENFAQRPAKLVAEELNCLVESFNPDHIWFADDNFVCGRDWIRDFDKYLSGNKPRVSYSIQSRADLLDPEVIEYLKSSGCSEVWLGAESGSEKILRSMNKGVSIKQLRTASSELQKAGIRVCLFFQFGYPDEDFDDILASADLIREIFPDNIGVSVTYPLPGTRLYQSVCNRMGEQTHWNDSDDLAMLFQGRYETPFYKKLHGVLHDELELRHRLENATENGEFRTAELLKQVSRGWLELGQMESTHRREKNN